MIIRHFPFATTANRVARSTVHESEHNLQRTRRTKKNIVKHNSCVIGVITQGKPGRIISMSELLLVVRKMLGTRVETRTI